VTRGRSRRRPCALHRSGRGVRLRRARGRRSARAGLRLRLRDAAADEQGECGEKDGDRSWALRHLTSKFTAAARRLARSRPAGLLAVVTTIVGAAVGSNLAVLVLHIWGRLEIERAEARRPALPAIEA
jgi:hypothetical protein